MFYSLQLRGGGSLAAPKPAFTLAEVLVTLGIIGVVSAMTVPTLMQNYQRKSYVTQLHKVYNEMAQAFVQYQNDKNALNLAEAGLTSQASLNNFVADYFKVVQTCENALTPCFIEQTSYRKLTGGSLGSPYTVQTSYVLASGASIRLHYSQSGDRLGYIMADLNGNKGPNILGRDLFTITFYKNGLMDDNGTSAPLSDDERDKLFDTYCSKSTSSDYGCFGKILNDNWEMTY